MEKYIYKITNKINNKIYIGQTKDYHRRFREHKNCMYDNERTKNKHLYNAIKKYGVENFDFELIEKTEDYNEREQYWINFYGTKNSEKGYNKENNGHENRRDTLTDEEIQEIFNLIENSELSFKDIAKLFNFKNEDSIKKINRGECYYHKTKNYPLRKGKFDLAQEKVQNIIKDLKNLNLTVKEIADKYNTLPSYIYQINNGDRLFQEKESYPIRETMKRKKRTEFSQKDIFLIKQDIKNTNLKWTELVKKYGGNPKVYQHINQGKTYYDETEDYPLRKIHNTRRSLNDEQIKEVINLLKNTSILQKDIAKKYSVSEPVIKKIKSGTPPYNVKGEKYPLR